MDLERLFDFIAEQDLDAATSAVHYIGEAVELLERHPMIGRPSEEGLRELVISYGKSGYVALYVFVETEDVVLVPALRHQREGGYPG
jgi:plasmid stabilization system protein ParE